MIINNTSEFFEELTKAALTNSGWEVELVNGFIRATHPNSEESYLICTVGRSLSDRQKKETPMISAKIPKINKLKEVLKNDTYSSIPCISYGIAKYSIDDFELAIVPLNVIEENAKSGGVYSVTKKGYYYNYTQIRENEVPIGCVYRKLWKATIMQEEN